MIRSVRSLQDAEAALRELDDEIRILKHSVVPISSLPKLNVTIILAPLSATGTQGSITIQKGIVTAYKQPK